MTDLDGELPRTPASAPPGLRQCFGCGEDNPIGLRLRVRRDGDLVRATMAPGAHYQGYPDVLHGGLLATALDEMLGYASILVAGVWAATATMELRYRAPAPSDQPLELVGGIQQARGRRVRAWARGHLAGGEVAAEAAGLLVALPADLAERARRRYGAPPPDRPGGELRA